MIGGAFAAGPALRGTFARSVRRDRGGTADPGLVRRCRRLQSPGRSPQTGVRYSASSTPEVPNRRRQFEPDRRRCPRRRGGWHPPEEDEARRQRHPGSRQWDVSRYAAASRSEACRGQPRSGPPHGRRRAIMDRSGRRRSTRDRCGKTRLPARSPGTNLSLTLPGWHPSSKPPDRRRSLPATEPACRVLPLVSAAATSVPDPDRHSLKYQNFRFWS